MSSSRAQQEQRRPVAVQAVTARDLHDPAGLEPGQHLAASGLDRRGLRARRRRPGRRGRGSRRPAPAGPSAGAAARSATASSTRAAFRATPRGVEPRPARVGLRDLPGDRVEVGPRRRGLAERGRRPRRRPRASPPSAGGSTTTTWLTSPGCAAARSSATTAPSEWPDEHVEALVGDLLPHVLARGRPRAAGRSPGTVRSPCPARSSASVSQPRSARSSCARHQVSDEEPTPCRSSADRGVVTVAASATRARGLPAVVRFCA